MELDELKYRWEQWELTIKEQQLFNKKTMKEIHKDRYKKSLSQLINYTFLGCLIALLAIILVIYRLSTVYFGPFKMTIIILAITFIISLLISGITNLKLLYKIDYSKPVNHNIELTRTYKIRVKRQHLIGYISISIILFLAIIASLLSPNMELWRWFAIGGTVIVGMIGSIWEYKRIYKKNISSILESLEEIKELEEE